MTGKPVSLLFVVLLVFFGIQAGAAVTTLPEVQLPLAPAATLPPYDDEAFFEKANKTIQLICTGESLPVGGMNQAVYDSLGSTYYSLIRMNISEDNYPRAETISSFLSYTLTLLEQYDAYQKEKEKPSMVNLDTISYRDLEQWYDAAAGVWDTISSGYPEAEMYGMPPEVEPSSWVGGQFPVV